MENKRIPENLAELARLIDEYGLEEGVRKFQSDRGNPNCYRCRNCGYYKIWGDLDFIIVMTIFGISQGIIASGALWFHKVFGCL